MDPAISSLSDRAGLDRAKVRQLIGRGLEGADDGELFLERLTKLVAAHFADQLCKCRAVTNLTQRKATRPVYSRIIVMYG